ncbi:uncharacterized protein LOC110626376 [Manihot esculenta]|uniref:Uncharacterized protein n=2 Tax=Manihot esculenta TaxID=3983 RepID=A0ACB7GU70_MANES|nr:uncharacterized protein LOC110626376 [Manihot esculenta]KAG8643765.1 hypothetical protein MANES_11G060425v8 [Manihot esculenta]
MSHLLCKTLELPCFHLDSPSATSVSLRLPHLRPLKRHFSPLPVQHVNLVLPAVATNCFTLELSLVEEATKEQLHPQLSHFTKYLDHEGEEIGESTPESIKQLALKFKMMVEVVTRLEVVMICVPEISQKPKLCHHHSLPRKISQFLPFFTRSNWQSLTSP